jgi:hypothetical protein
MLDRVTRFFREQFAKTVQRPSRLFFGPLSYLVGKRAFAFLAGFLLPLVPRRALEKGREEAILLHHRLQAVSARPPGRGLAVARPSS